MCFAIAALGMTAMQTAAAAILTTQVVQGEKGRSDAKKQAKEAAKMKDFGQMGLRQGQGARIRPQSDQRPKGKRTLRVGGGSTGY